MSPENCGFSGVRTVSPGVQVSDRSLSHGSWDKDRSHPSSRRGVKGVEAEVVFHRRNLSEGATSGPPLTLPRTQTHQTIGPG